MDKLAYGGLYSAGHRRLHIELECRDSFRKKTSSCAPLLTSLCPCNDVWGDICDLGRIHRVSSVAVATLPTDGSFGKGKGGAHTSIPIERKPHTEPRAKTDTPQPWNMIPNRHFPLILGPAAAAGSSAVSPAGTEGSASSSGHSLQLEEAPSALYRLMFLKLRQEL